MSELARRGGDPTLCALRSVREALASYGSHQANALPRSPRQCTTGPVCVRSIRSKYWLARVVEDGRMPIDDNLLERNIRIFATGQKSWLFCDTVGGARAIAVIYSPMLACRACNVEPLAWLRHVFTQLPQRLNDVDIDDLLPFTRLNRHALRCTSSDNYDGRAATLSGALRNSRLLTIGCRTGCSVPTKNLSIAATTLGISSSTGRGRLCPSDSETGRTGSDQ